VVLKTDYLLFSLCIKSQMSWLTREIQQSDAEQSDREQTVSENEAGSPLGSRALECWHRLAEGCANDVREFRSHGSAKFEQPSEFECRVSNSDGGVAVQLSGDMPELLIRYEYQSEGEKAGVPEGGVLTIRDVGRSAELYSADQHLTFDQARKLILEPVLFPKRSDALEETGT
jgi:hypothetical protein